MWCKACRLKDGEPTDLVGGGESSTLADVIIIVHSGSSSTSFAVFGFRSDYSARLTNSSSVKFRASHVGGHTIKLWTPPAPLND